MKRLMLIICAAGFMFSACNNEKKPEEKTAAETTTDSATSDAKSEKAWIPIDSATGMKAMIEYGTPGEPHKLMAKSNGSWNAEITMWMADGAPPMTSKGKSVNSMIYGGRYQQSKFAGSFGEMPFEGTAVMGYDNAEKKFVSSWMDNMSTGIMNMSGTWDEGSKSMTLTGKQKNPANGLECNLREVFKMVDDNTQVMEMYGPDPATGKEYKMMEIKYTRKK